MSLDTSPPWEAQQFLERLWRLENDERPGFLIGYAGPRVIGGEAPASALFSTDGPVSVKERLLDPRKYLAAQLEEIESARKLPGDYVPSLCPSLGVVAIPSAFGCEVVWWEGDFPSVKPIIEEDPEKVRDLPRPEATDGVLGRILDYVRFFREETGDRYPIRITDIQGPLDSAALIWGHNDFLLALATRPKEVHELLDAVTDLTIEFVKKMHGAAGPGFVPSLFQPWIPGRKGISVSNDECVMISAEMHDEFSIPYLNRLSDAFGGIFVHSCGNWLHQLESLDKVRNLRGVEFGASETPFEPVAKHFGGRAVVSCRVGLNRDFPFVGMADYVRRIQEWKATNCGLFIQVDVTNGILGPDWPPTDLDEILCLLKS